MRKFLSQLVIVSCTLRCKPQNTSYVNHLLYFVAIICLSQAGNLARFAAAPPEVLGFWRLLGAALVMLLFAATHQSQIRLYKEFNQRNIMFAILSGFFFFVHLWTYKFAAQNTTIANGMILFATNPLLTAIITITFMKESFQKRYFISYALAMTSIYLLIHQNLQLNSKNSLGDLSALASALFYSLYIIFGKKARHAMSNPAYTFFIYSFASLCFLAFALWKGTDLIHYPTQTWIGIALLITFPTMLGHAIFSYLLKNLNINWMSTGKLAEPILATIAAYFFFSEELSSNTALSFSLTAVAIFILIAPYQKTKSEGSK